MPKFIDLSGKKIGRLTVTKKVEYRDSHRPRIKWHCVCDCGNELDVFSYNLTSGHTKSCGCLNGEMTTERNTAIFTKHSEANSRLYNIWHSMKSRCNNPNRKDYHLYGERGIKVCEEWEKSYPAFRDWAIENGYDENAPFGQCTIDRIDNEKGYSPDNCRWITNEEQQKNKRRCR